MCNTRALVYDVATWTADVSIAMTYKCNSETWNEIACNGSNASKYY